MAEIKLTRDQLTNPDLWPDACARCGQAETELHPVPERRTKGVTGLNVPLCPRHRDHWAQHAARNRPGLLVILGMVVGLPVLLWFLTAPDGPMPVPRDNRVGIIFFGTLVPVAVVGIAWASWAGGLIRVQQVRGERITLMGVARVFATAWSEHTRQRLTPPEVHEDLTFPVEAFRPTGHAPITEVLRTGALMATAGAAAGGVIGGLSLLLENATAGWDKDDPMFLGVSAAIFFSYVILLIGGRVLVQNRHFWKAAILIVLVLTGIVGLTTLFCNCPLRTATHLGLSVPALFLMMPLANRLIYVYRIRQVTVGWLLGALGPALVTLAALAVTGWYEGPQGNLVWIGLLLALIGAATAGAQAGSPTCEVCGEWMLGRDLGALPGADMVVPVLSRGEIVRLATSEPREKAIPGDVHIRLHACPACLEVGPFILELAVVSEDNRHREARKSAGRWQYPAEAWPVIERIFPGATPSAESPQDDESPSD